MWKQKLRDGIISLLLLTVTTLFCILMQIVNDNANFAPMLFILTVFLIARFTRGYLWGILSSLLGMLLANFVFTYPYWEFNFTLSGYPLTMGCMLAVSVITSSLITQNKNQELTRLEMEREKMKSNLLRAVSHDLRTPLTSISGACSVLLESGEQLSKPQQKKLLTDIREEANWLIRMVENLLSVTRIGEEKTAKVVKTPEPVEEIVADLAGKFKKQFPGSPLTINIPEDFLMVPMDAILIEQVLINLLENAVVHAKTATRIVLSVEQTEHEAIFSVSDNGVGIDKERLPHLFDGYFSGKETTLSDGKRNMGIGLSVCNAIIRAHKGKMKAENLKEGGCRFSFTLPLEEERSYE